MKEEYLHKVSEHLDQRLSEITRVDFQAKENSANVRILEENKGSIGKTLVSKNRGSLHYLLTLTERKGDHSNNKGVRLQVRFKKEDQPLSEPIEDGSTWHGPKNASTTHQDIINGILSRNIREQIIEGLQTR